MKLTAENVRILFNECLFIEGEDTEAYIKIDGIMMSVGLHPSRLKENTVAIRSMLMDLSDDFKASGGGGMSFLNMCIDNKGVQWADLHETMDKLVVLGIAIGEMSYLMPRDMWPALPGGMPYLQIK